MVGDIRGGGGTHNAKEPHLLHYLFHALLKYTARIAKETHAKCQNKQLQLTHYVTRDWQPFHNISAGNVQ